jgi:hypothetical protein
MPNSKGSQSSGGQKGSGQGNFGNPQQHAEAGRQSSGNRGNPEQHAEAGRQGGRSSGEGNGGNGGEQEGGQEGGGTAMMEHDRDMAQGVIDQLRTLMQQLQKDRQFHLDEAEEINQGLTEIKTELDGIIGEDDSGGQGSGGQGRGNGGIVVASPIKAIKETVAVRVKPARLVTVMKPAR